MMMNTRQFEQGFGLIELMIAITLGLVITAGVLQVFLATKKTYKITENHAQLQDNARFALEVLTKDIRQAGYIGCREVDNLNIQVVAKSNVPDEISSDTVISGLNADADNTWNLDPHSKIESMIEPGTDAISLIKVASCGANVSGSVSSSSAEIKVVAPNTCNLQQGDIVMVSDCKDGHLFSITNNPNDGSNSNKTSQNLAHAKSNNTATHFCTTASENSNGSCATGTDKLYGYDAEVFKFSSVTYFIGRDEDSLSLYQYDATQSEPSEIVEGIENMQIIYGLDDDGDDVIDRTETAKTVEDESDWGNVVSAEVNLLVQSPEDHLTEVKQTYHYNGDTYQADDNRLRRVFTTTVVVRNRLQ